MATTDAGFLKATDNQRPGHIFTWTVTILACAYIGWIGVSLYYSTPIFINMYVSMGVDLSLSTKILIGFYRLMYPILFGGMAALVITKQFFVRNKWMSVSVTLAATVAVSLISEGIVRALYRPLFDMAERLSK
ncbi:MAG TPA: hypothetical protein VKV30_02395 [Candidatus Angelobacter sp.]|nr:hypothetical protein [Candidatus Angelobacter sp.]